MKPALLVIDVQNEYVDGAMPIQYPPVAGSLERIGAAMEAAASAGLPIALIQHSSPEAEAQVFVSGSDGWQLHETVTSRKHDTVIGKHLPGSFTGTTLQQWLADQGVDQVAICGYMTHMCVDTTSRQANHLGLEVTVLGDAAGTIDLGPELPAELVHRVELGVLGSGFASVTTVAEWSDTLA